MIRWLFFGVISLSFVALSGRSLIEMGSHGFWRFWAFECLLGLVVENSMYWFVKPLSGSQILSWAMLLGSILMAGHAVYLLRRTGRPNGSIEKTTELVTGGVYRYIRHPLYASLILLGWGSALKYPSWLALGLAGAGTLLLFWTAYFEERELLGRFGQRYLDYMRATKMFLPFVV
ncbi:MAG: isoprenylcysteine carboxylmethyltransferase family protein [Anaerolineales bacterium]